MTTTYVPTTWIDDVPPGTGTPVNAPNMNKIEAELVRLGNLIDSLTSAVGAQAVIPIGAILDWPYSGTSIPSWALLPYGQPIARATYAALHALVQGVSYGPGGIWAGNGTTTFGLPDLRGCVTAGKDDMGGVAALKITAAISGTAGTVLGAAVGSEGVTLTTAHLPAHNHAVTGLPGLSGVVSNGTLGVGVGSLALPNHLHGVNEGNHGHNVNDGPHSHSAGGGQYFTTAAGPSGGEYAKFTGQASGLSLYTSTPTSINPSGVSVQANPASGIAVNNPTTLPGVTGAPALSGAVSNGNLAATLGTLNTQLSPAAGAHTIMQPTIVVNKFIRAL